MEVLVFLQVQLFPPVRDGLVLMIAGYLVVQNEAGCGAAKLCRALRQVGGLGDCNLYSSTWMRALCKSFIPDSLLYNSVTTRV